MSLLYQPNLAKILQFLVNLMAWMVEKYHDLSQIKLIQYKHNYQKD